MGNSSAERCRPFDLERQGLNLGEGAAAVVLERGEEARRRGGEVLALVAGYGSASDAYHPTAPHPNGRGLRHAIATALENARLDPAAVAFVNAHGTGTQENDRVEGCVLADMLPPATLVFSTKGYTGHTLGAAGAIEAVFTIHNLLDHRVPASAGFSTPDPACRVRPTTSTTPFAGKAALSTSLAFGGANAVLAFCG
jgi:3-oxoacyl-(acyl-carrier-protein) synthase